MARVNRAERDIVIECRALFFIAIVSISLSLWIVNSADADYYHDLEKNRQPCNDCHTLHYSESGTQPPGVEPGGPFQQLLIRATTTKLCLFCHDGSDPKAPDVLAPVTMYNGSGDEHSGAGFFENSGGAVSLSGHDLGIAAQSVPFSSMTNVTVSCASCHDPHGTPNYRNILTVPKGVSGDGTGVIMAADVFRNSPPTDPPSAQGSINAYKESNIGYKAKTSRWCTECHDNLRNHVGSATRTENHHLTDVPINGFGAMTDPAHWAGGTGTGFGAVTNDGVEGVPRLRFQSAGATDFPSSKVVAAVNHVTCSSCHLAHGGKFKKGLVWPYLEIPAGADANSGCQQCHNQ
jgi:hypothetical protein